MDLSLDEMENTAEETSKVNELEWVEWTPALESSDAKGGAPKSRHKKVRTGCLRCRARRVKVCIDGFSCFLFLFCLFFRCLTYFGVWGVGWRSVVCRRSPVVVLERHENWSLC
jgi:hypothetical protein